MNEIELGTGVLTWISHERRSDRYGTVYLIPEGGDSLGGVFQSLVDGDAIKQIVGKRGALKVVVTATRQSRHIGDLFHNVYPRTPNVGDRIVLGTGTAFCEGAPDGGLMVGVEPDDGRPDLWMGMRALYDAHEQSVRLVFVAGDGEAK